MREPACVYLPLEPVASRYTYDLCNKDDGWMVATLKTASWRRFFYGGVTLATHLRPDIKTGAVLDAYTRSAYAMKQCEWVCGLLDHGLLKNGDVLFLQDFWTPGLEAILYCAHMCNVRLRIYAMVHAQSVDQYDFTHDMRHWMRPIELGYAKVMSGLFVASSIHKEQLRLAGVECPIHVVSLPYDERINANKYRINGSSKDRTVIYSSRIDKEKQPEFMLRVAKSFLETLPQWRWVVTTSSAQLRSYNNSGFIKELRAFARRNKRFIIKEGLTKQEYHRELEGASIQFNCSLQDYVSWTLIEACHHRCFPVYPNFRSFPECLPPTILYKPWSDGHAVRRLLEAARDGNGCVEEVQKRVLNASLQGRFALARTVYHGLTNEINVWDLLP